MIIAFSSSISRKAILPWTPQCTASNYFQRKISQSVCLLRQSLTSNVDDNRSLQPLVVCGPSGVGKGTIISKYMEMHGDSNFGFAVSHTTRKPRPGEINGIHYHFTDYNSLEDSIRKGEFLEFAEVHGNLYGTSFDSLRYLSDAQGKIPILDIDVQGVMSVKEKVKQRLTELQPKYIFIAPPSMDTLKERLLSRGTEDDESVERRSRNALEEIKYGLTKGNFDGIVVNENLNQAIADFAATVLKVYKEGT